MTCETARPLLESYAAGEGSLGQKEAVGRHLESCPACARELRWLRAMKGSLLSLSEPPMPAGLTEDLLRIARGRRRENSFRDALRRFWEGPLWRGLVPAAALATGLVILTRFSSVGMEEMDIGDVLEAHARYSLTMPAADRETLYAGLTAEESDDF